MKAGLIVELINGVCMTRLFLELHRADADFAPAISSILIPQSYVSLEFILQRHGILTEVTYPTSAVTFKHTHLIENKLGVFAFRNIKENLYAGYSIADYFGIPFSQASLAKALFDYLYFCPWKDKTLLSGYNLAEDLRLNLEEFSNEAQTEFAGFVDMSQSRKMDQTLKNLRKTIWRL